MKHDQSMASEHEQQVLEHFRTHSQGEPSAAVDAQIMAAARAALTPAAERRGLAARLHAWLFAERGHQRWSLALAGVACLGIGVSLTWRNFEQRPMLYDSLPVAAEQPAAARQAPSVPVQLAAPVAEMRARAVQQEAVQEEPRSSLKRLAPVQATSQATPAVQASVAESAAVSADALPLQAETDVQAQLQQLLQLRLEGAVQEAEVLMQKIKREYPDLDIEERLRRLQAPQ